MSDIGIRALTGALYVAITLSAAFAGVFTTALLFLPVCLFAANELHSLLWEEHDGPPAYWSVLLVGTAYFGLAAGPLFQAWRADYLVGLVFVLVLVSITWMLFRGSKAPGKELGATFLMIFLIALPFGLLPHLLRQGEAVMVGFFILLWTNDTGAYLVGRAIGRHKLMPAVSPKKTVEGLIGGIALTLGVAWLLWRTWPLLSLRDWIICGGIIAVAGTLGDLLESALKRERGVKDSGTLLPGHGGILDRFDGLLLAAPAMYLYLLLAH